ncbi:MAG: RNA methylase [Saprospiraceae bacterium]|nr:RNA methylase [Saprospiraceae bacterium]
MSRDEKWDDLYEKSERLTRPYSIDDVLGEQEMIDLEKSVIRIINRFLDKGELHKGIKVYVNHHLKNDLVDKMVEIRPEENESIEEWGMRIFGHDRYGVVFNSLETYDNTLAEIMCSVVSPLIKKAGLPLGGISFLFFMGNYGFTPFGIHKEAKGEEGFLFHLGPGEKVFFSWDIEELNMIEHNTQVFHEELEEMLPSSKEHVLEAGSVMFIPHQVYHIANTKDFSLSIVMDYINPSKDNLEKELAKEINNQDYSQNVISTYLDPVQESDTEITTAYPLDAKSIMTKFRNSFDKRVLRLKSNSGLINSSIKNNRKQLPNGEFKLRGKKVFPIYIKELDEQSIIIFARGNEIIKKPNSNLKLVISELNGGNVLPFNSMKEYLMPQWDLVEVYGLVSDLIVIEAIEII